MVSLSTIGADVMHIGSQTSPAPGAHQSPPACANPRLAEISVPRGASIQALLCRPEVAVLVSRSELLRAEAIGSTCVAIGRGLWRATAAAIAGLEWLVARLAEGRERACQRRMLRALDHRALRDLGITPVDAWREGSKPFWRK